MRNFLYYNDVVGRIIHWIHPGGLENENQLNLYRVSQKEKMLKTWSTSFYYLEKLNRDIKSNGRILIVVSIPLKMEIDAGQFRQVVESNGLKNEDLDLSQQYKAIYSFCEKIDTPILNPRPEMILRNREKRCYFVYDGHWNSEGIRVTTHSLADQWKKLELLPWKREY